MIINALDDPLTVPSNAFRRMPGEVSGPSFAEMVAESSCGLLLMAPSGAYIYDMYIYIYVDIYMVYKI